jgi:hypothetical protein
LSFAIARIILDLKKKIQFNKIKQNIIFQQAKSTNKQRQDITQLERAVENSRLFQITANEQKKFKKNTTYSRKNN